VKKRQISAYVDSDTLQRLDRWLKWQKDNRGYETDRSHVINVLLRRFIDDNEEVVSAVDSAYEQGYHRR
jgi:hypothetical protein